MKYKVGDRVRVKSREWYFENGKGGAFECGGQTFVSDMLEYCGAIAIVSTVAQCCYALEGIGLWVFTDEMLEPALTPGNLYWVSDESEKHAIHRKNASEFAVEFEGRMYFRSSVNSTSLTCWKYAVPVESPAEYFIVKKHGGEVIETKLTDKQREELGI